MATRHLLSGATWPDSHHRSHHRTSGQWWRSTVATDGQRRRSTVADHRSTTAGPPVNGGGHLGYWPVSTACTSVSTGSRVSIVSRCISTEDANQKFLRSLPASWSQVSLIMRTKPGVDNLSFDDLYNNLKVFKPDVKGSTRSFSSA
ncbi:hypothetical protein Tco_0542289 [Tanacetum coccineum]